MTTPFNLEETDKLLSTTRAVRKRLDLEKPVERDILLDCVRLSQQAPTGSNTQMWRWVIVQDEEKKKAIADVYARGSEFIDQMKGQLPEDAHQTHRVYDSAGYLFDVLHKVPAIAVQESVFAGVWTLKSATADYIEVAEIPAAVLANPFAAHRPGLGHKAPLAPGVVNAPPMLVELLDKSAAFDPEAPLHVINLSLLPHTEEDLVWLDQAAGEGAVTILSRGYGNCRVTATSIPHVWRVQFFNSMDTLILDTFEVTTLPEVALAAREDLADSGARILQVLEAIR